MTSHRHELPFGATLVAPNRTRFRLWAPSRDEVSVEIEGRPPVPMQRAEGGWFETEVECGAGTRYRYRLDAELAVPDPAARAQAGDIDGPSLVVDPETYQWRATEWQGRPWHETVLYELHVGALGGYKGVAERLPYLAEIGITAVELMPVAEFPGARNWGYDGVLPYAPESSYGTPEDLKALVDRAHELGLMIFLDVVYNHFGPEGNYLPVYAKPFFREDLHTPWGPAIDFRRPEVRDFFTQNAIYWVQEYRFDGLRFDAVHAISEQDWLVEMAAAVRAAAEPGRHVHLVLEHDANAANLLTRGFDAQWNDDSHHIAHRLLTGETEGYYVDYKDRPAERLARFLAEGFVYQGDPSPHREGEARGEPSAHLPPTAFVSFLQNHDQIGNRALGDRLTTLADPDALRAAKALYLMTPQIPMLFMGEEWGSQTPFLYFTDHPHGLAEAVREGRRKEFASFPAFADPKVRERIPDPNAADTFHASIPKFEEAQGPELDFTRELLAKRKELAPLMKGAEALGAKPLGDAAVEARWKLADGSVLTVISNLSSGAVSCSGHEPGKVLVETQPGAADALRRGELPGAATVVYLGGAA